jgi:steroid delta-isomerase-like uncharacterized protein
MALEIRERCEKCGGSLAPMDAATICSYECTFCPPCSAAMAHTCPNCGGQLVARPRRQATGAPPRSVIRRLHELWTAGDLDAVEEVYAPDFVGHFPSSSHLPERLGHAGVREGIRRIKLAFPDWREDVDEMVAEGRRVVTRYTSRGTHHGEFRGIAPTGRSIAVREISIYRVVKGKVVEQWCLLDELDRLQQLGARPSSNG